MYNLLTLVDRRSLMDMGLIYDNICDRKDCTILFGKVRFNTPSYRTRHTQLLNVPSHSHLSSYGKNVAGTKITRPYNTIFNSVDSFIMTRITFMSI